MICVPIHSPSIEPKFHINLRLAGAGKSTNL